MKCFIAIDLTKEIQKELSRIQKELPEAKMKLVNPEKVHITMKFLGELNDKEINKVKDVIKKIQFNKFKARLSGLGIFTPSFIKVVWFSVEPKENFKKIHDNLYELLSAEGFKLDNKWEAHATIARVKFVKDKKEFIEKLNQIKISPLEFSVDKIKLKKSTFNGKEHIYEDL